MKTMFAALIIKTKEVNMRISYQLFEGYLLNKKVNI